MSRILTPGRVMLEGMIDLCLELRLLGEGVERLENYVHVELSEVTCRLTVHPAGS
jgi:hypothetical protein